MTEYESSLEERKDLLVLAQQKLDENRGPKSPSKKSTAASNLLLTLLYLALMSFKVEDMKAMLKHIDFDSYEQWDALLTVLHSPEFHVKERSLQNERAARMFERKNHYKTKASALNVELTASLCKLDELQKISNETNNEMSKTIHALQQEASELHSKLHDSQAKIELEREAIQTLKGEVARKDFVIDGLNQQLDNTSENAHALQQELAELNDKLHHANAKIQLEREAVQSLKDKLTSKDLAIEGLKQQLDNSSDKLTELCESKSRVETIESRFDTYMKDKEAQVNKLQQDLIKAEFQNTSLSGQFASLSENLDSKMDLLCKSAAELLDVARKASNAQIEDRSSLKCINTLSQEMHNVLLKVVEQKQVDVDEILRTIQSSMCGKEVPSQDKDIDETNESEHRATAFVQNVLSEAFASAS